MISIIPSWKLTLPVNHDTPSVTPSHLGYLASTTTTGSHPFLHLQIDEDAIRALLLSPTFTSTFTRLSKNHGLALPLRFPSHQFPSPSPSHRTPPDQALTLTTHPHRPTPPRSTMPPHAPTSPSRNAERPPSSPSLSPHSSPSPPSTRSCARPSPRSPPTPTRAPSRASSSSSSTPSSTRRSSIPLL